VKKKAGIANGVGSPWPEKWNHQMTQPSCPSFLFTGEISIFSKRRSLKNSKTRK
jgi:hypothetical protein